MLTKKERKEEGEAGWREGRKDASREGREGWKEKETNEGRSFTTQNDVLFNKTPITWKQNIKKVNKFLDN